MGMYLATLCFVTLLVGQCSGTGVNPTTIDVLPTVNPEEIEWIVDSTKVFGFTLNKDVKLRYTAAGNGIKITNLKACNTLDCSGYTVDLLDAVGCPVVYGGSYQVLPGGFVRQGTTSVYETAPFPMFRWIGQIPMFLLGTKDLCETGGAECDDLCGSPGKRRKRDTNGTHVMETGDARSKDGLPKGMVFGKGQSRKAGEDGGVSKDIHMVETPKILVEIKQPVISQNFVENLLPELSCLDESTTLPSVALMGSITGAACAMAGFLSYQVHAIKLKKFSPKA